MTARREALGEQRCELFPRSVVARWRSPRERSEDRDAEWNADLGI